ncbi:integration host factor, actinobacterial type [Adlercreutzia sp. R21]|uniref:Integration host factor, actinobacterial type n=1 Tax=Adlercreutzia wanghongyangiae TaxID=3111451 RepID=A0ABU6IKL8_9ACTN|nr:integration host factor, actinobacterial type [Adlercreutzia sp. R21]MEC4176944.1 integration host factor, actinobacterial type [Adlercreutzia sp. R7]MEC4185207.1 integration host factor, actinobacterial type [Adlercreutzia sp. R21]
MPAPTMTPEQRAAALEKARIVRAERSELTQKLSMGLLTPAEVLDQTDNPVIGRMKVKAFVNALPGFGKVKTEKLMEELGIPAERRLQGLGSNQMQALKDALA